MMKACTMAIHLKCGYHPMAVHTDMTAISKVVTTHVQITKCASSCQTRTHLLAGSTTIPTLGYSSVWEKYILTMPRPNLNLEMKTPPGNMFQWLGQDQVLTCQKFQIPLPEKN